MCLTDDAQKIFSRILHFLSKNLITLLIKKQNQSQKNPLQHRQKNTQKISFSEERKNTSFWFFLLESINPSPELSAQSTIFDDHKSRSTTLSLDTTPSHQKEKKPSMVSCLRCESKVVSCCMSVSCCESHVVHVAFPIM